MQPKQRLNPIAISLHVLGGGVIRCNAPMMACPLVVEYVNGRLWEISQRKAGKPPATWLLLVLPTRRQVPNQKDVGSSKVPKTNIIGRACPTLLAPFESLTRPMPQPSITNQYE